jgi:flagellar basal-body rod protein FlgG
VARVALARKDLVHTMTFISPTGLSAKDDKRGQPMLESKAFAHSSSHWWSPIAFRAIASLEASNVDIVNEMVNLISAQRAYEINSKVVTAADEMLRNATSMES